MDAYQVNIEYNDDEVVLWLTSGGFYAFVTAYSESEIAAEKKSKLLAQLLPDIQKFRSHDPDPCRGICMSINLPAHYVDTIIKFAQDFIEDLDASMKIPAERVMHM